MTDTQNTIPPHSMLLAIDASGKLHTCPIWHKYYGESRCEEGDHLLDMQQCHFGITRVSPKRGRKEKSTVKSTPDGEEEGGDSPPPLSFMNTLTARLESTPVATIGGIGGSSRAPGGDPSKPSVATSPTENPPTGRRGRGRNRSPTERIAAPTATEPRRIHLVASNSNESILPSRSPPVVMLLSSDAGPSTGFDGADDRRSTGTAWSEIPGLERVRVPMTCILFASRSACGPAVWNGVASATRSDADEGAPSAPGDPDRKRRAEGVVLMGFQDGCLRASFVVVDEACASDDGAAPSITVDAGEATPILQLSANEPFVSLQLLPLPSGRATSPIAAPVLICVGALGTRITLSSSLGPGEQSCGTSEFVIEDPLKPCGGRWISMAYIGYRFSDSTEDLVSLRSTDSIPSIVLSFVGVNDSSHTFFHDWKLPGKHQFGNKVNDAGCGQSVHRLPIPARMALSTYAFPGLIHASDEHSSRHFTFTMSAPNGKVVVLRMPLPGTTPISRALHGLELSAANPSLLPTLKGGGDNADGTNSPQKSQKINHHQEGHSLKLQSLLRKLDAATTKQNKIETNQLFDSINHQSNHAIKEIREATQIAAFVKNPSSRGMLSPMQCEIKKLNPPKPGMLECIITTEKLPLAKQPATAWVPSVHILQSCPHALSPLLRPESIESMSPICYRRTARGDGRPSIVLYGGTATSYSGHHANRDVEGCIGRTMNIHVPMNDFIPASAYASLSMVYTSHLSENIHQNQDDTWCSSAKIPRTPSNDGWQHIRGIKEEAVQSEVLNLTGLAKRAGFRRKDRSGSREFLGLSLPFDMGTNMGNKSLLPLGILAYNASHDPHHSAVQLGREKNIRESAEKLVRQWYQNQSMQTDSQREYVIPFVKEQNWIRNYSRSSTKFGDAEDNRYCCSTSMRCMSRACDVNTLIGGRETYCVNLGFGPMAIARGPTEEGRETTFDQGIDDVGIAVASNMITPSESMAILPLIRRSIVQHCLEHIHPQKIRNSKDYLELLESYHGLLSSKRTRKLTKHIIRSSEELLVDIEKSQDDTHNHLCPKDILTASISLYETMRTINVAL